MDKIYNIYDLETLSKLAEIVKDNELSEIKLVDGGKSLTIKGKKSQEVVAQPTAMPVQTTFVTNESPISEPEKETGMVVKSPILGTFYAAASPDDKPFVSVGQKVNKGDVIFIIETMKVMNEVKSEYSGTVKEILVSDAEALEYDQPIMIIE